MTRGEKKRVVLCVYMDFKGGGSERCKAERQGGCDDAGLQHPSGPHPTHAVVPALCRREKACAHGESMAMLEIHLNGSSAV